MLDTMEKQLQLAPSVMEPSRAGLYRFGNVSSTSIWYVLAFIESHRSVARGDKVRVGLGPRAGREGRRCAGRGGRSRAPVHSYPEHQSDPKPYETRTKPERSPH